MIVPPLFFVCLHFIVIVIVSIIVVIQREKAFSLSKKKKKKKKKIRKKTNFFFFISLVDLDGPFLDPRRERLERGRAGAQLADQRQVGQLGAPLALHGAVLEREGRAVRGAGDALLAADLPDLALLVVVVEKKKRS